MCSTSAEDLDKPHAVCIPYPAQGHINPMLKLAKILHHKGFHITFVNTEHNHKRFLKSRGPDSLQGLASFRFETIPDGLPPCDPDATQDIASLCKSTTTTCLGPFKELLARLNNTSSSNVPPISCIVADGSMSFTLSAAQDLGIPQVFFRTVSACGLLGYMHYRDLVEKGYTPLKDESYLTNGYLDITLDWIPGMNGIRLRDLPSFVRTTNPEEYVIKFAIQEAERSKNACAMVLNTFEPLEREVLESLQTLLPPIYAIGPLHLLVKHVEDKNLEDLGSNLWKEETKCLDWLDSKKRNSVVYVSFGSITLITPNPLIEFAWGLANSQLDFLKWGIGMELDNYVKRDDVETLVRELLTGEKGKEMKKNALEWKKLAEEAAQKPAGSSYANIDKLIIEILLSSKNHWQH
ncbi:7-deoxyloganetin glucosyltransferase [Capsicum annuum]|uniref:7-deoxyloganetin glucosyltransferase n=1 Tax=Capsicum annuum TaxID=4072 RepID=A0A2G2Z2M5_CAPAN|nr:7-deoxyloganetin glucosyltransferase [Capsicum annuum]